MQKTHYILLSHYLTDNTPTYGNRDRLSVRHTSLIAEGSSANSSEWVFSTNHVGSHIDMPKHFDDEGKTLTDYQPDDWFFNNVQLVDIPKKAATLIVPSDLPDPLDSNLDLLLIRTGYEQRRGSEPYWRHNPGVHPDLGGYLREKCPQIRALGFDFISLTSWQHRDVGKTTHQLFLKKSEDTNPIWILEDLALSGIHTEILKVIVAPVFVLNGNGSPVTVFAETLD